MSKADRVLITAILKTFTWNVLRLPVACFRLVFGEPFFLWATLRNLWFCFKGIAALAVFNDGEICLLVTEMRQHILRLQRRR